MLMDEFDPMVLQDLDDQKVFVIRSAKSNCIYIFAKLPNISNRLITDFDVEDTLDKIYILLYCVSLIDGQMSLLNI